MGIHYRRTSSLDAYVKCTTRLLKMKLWLLAILIVGIAINNLSFAKPIKETELDERQDKTDSTEAGATTDERDDSSSSTDSEISGVNEEETTTENEETLEVSSSNEGSEDSVVG